MYYSPGAVQFQYDCGQPPKHDLDILLVGKTGHGKSSTANSILDENIFVCGGSTASVTVQVQAYQKDMDGRKVFVVDTPGLCDTRYTENQEALINANEEAMHNFTLALSLSIEGFHAILLVFQYGNRMTQEEVNAIKEMKSLLGKDFIKNHGVLLMTRGEDFERDMKKSKEMNSFETWCREQGGFMKSVLEECQYRCLLFSNYAGDEEVLRRQRFDLLEMIDKMAGGQRYKGGIFERITKYWKSGDDNVDPDVRKTYLSSSTIYFRLVDLVRKTKVYDKKVVAEMRGDIEDLKITVQNVKGDAKEEVRRQIKKAETKINELEKVIASSPNGNVEDHPVIQAFVTAVNGTVTILAAPFFLVAGVISAAVIGIFQGIVEAGKLAGKVAEQCIIM